MLMQRLRSSQHAFQKHPFGIFGPVALFSDIPRIRGVIEKIYFITTIRLVQRNQRIFFDNFQGRIVLQLLFNGIFEILQRHLRWKIRKRR